MRLYQSASAIVLALTVSAGIAWAVEQPGPTDAPTPVTPVKPQDIQNLPTVTPTKSRQEVAHEKTIAAATRAHDAGVAATDALCKQDKALQTKTRQAAEAAQKELDAAAQAEAEFDPDVSKAHIASISAGLAENGVHPPEEALRLLKESDAAWDAYGKLKDAKAKEIAEAALQVVANPTPANTVCPPPAPAPQRNATVTPPAPAIIPSLPATPAKSIGMLRGFNDQMFKATLAQPGLRGRVETLMGLEGCDFSVSAAVSRQNSTRQAAAYLNRMNDRDLRDTLADGSLLDRIDFVFRRNQCAVAGPENNPLTAFPPANRPNPNDGPYPYGYPGDYGRGPNVPGPGLPGGPYGGYGGYGGYGIP
jgi:hypothetical protein